MAQHRRGKGLPTTTYLSDSRRSEPSTRSVGSTCIEWRANESEIIFHVVAGKARMILDAAESRDAGEN